MSSLTGRFGGICAILFVVLMVVGGALGFDSPDNDAPDQEWIDYLNDDAHLVWNLVGGYLMVIAGILFLVFLVSMYQRMRSAEGGDGSMSLLMLVTGIGWAICLMAGVIRSRPSPRDQAGQRYTSTPEVARWLPQIGFAVMLVAGGLVRRSCRQS